MRKYLLGFSSILVIFIIWHLYAKSIDNIYIIPTPAIVLNTLINLLKQSNTYLIILNTLLRLFIAFIVSAILGIFIGAISGKNEVIDEFLKPIIVSLRTLPVASIIIIIIVLVGSKYSLYVVTFLMIFPVVYEAAKSGILQIPKSLKDATKLEGHPKHIILLKIELPLAMPYIKTSLLQSIGLGFKVIVMAEYIAQTSRSIGQELFNGSQSVNYDRVFAWTIILILIVSLFEIFVRRINTQHT